MEALDLRRIVKWRSARGWTTRPSTDSAEDVIPPTAAEMKQVFALCKNDRWEEILERLQSNPAIAVEPMIMVNHISTTILHQAITSRGDLPAREQVIRRILDVSPRAAAIKNGYGSFPLHVISQRNTKIAARVKEKLVELLVDAYPDALLEPGGVGRRTPLHIIFTDYVSPRLTRILIHRGAAACSMKDKKGWLPAHVAASRHCSPEKLRMLLDVYPDAMYDVTDEGHTLLSLAKSTATASHPNFVLIEMLARLSYESTLPYSAATSTAKKGAICITPTSTTPTAVRVEASPLSLVRFNRSPTSSVHASTGAPTSFRYHVPPLHPFVGSEQGSPTPSSRKPSVVDALGHQERHDDRAAGLLLHFSLSRKESSEDGSLPSRPSANHVEV